MTDSYQIAPLHRRVFAMIYDFFIAGTFISVITGIVSAVLVWWKVRGLDIEELEKNKTVIQVIDPGSFLANSAFALQLALFFIYLTFFWLRSGRTPGAWVWKIQNLSKEGKGITISQAIIRFSVLVFILCGFYLVAYGALDLSNMQSILIMFLGFTFIIIWSRFNKAGLMLHEDISKTIGIDLR